MKRIRHYAGDTVDTINLPGGCYWVRVMDFDPVGISVGGVGGAPPLFESAGIRVDDSEFIPVTGNQRYSRNYNNPFKTLSLCGNIEVEVGEFTDVDPGPFIQSRLEYPVVDAAAGDGTAVVWPLAKGVRNISLRIQNAGLQISSIKLLSAYFLKGTRFGTQTAWRATGGPSNSNAVAPVNFGNPWFSEIVDLNNIQSAYFPLFNVNFVAPFPQAVTLMLMQGVPPADDLQNYVFVRPWAPNPILVLQVTTANVSASPIYGMFTN